MTLLPGMWLATQSVVNRDIADHLQELTETFLLNADLFVAGANVDYISDIIMTIIIVVVVVVVVVVV